MSDYRPICDVWILARSKVKFYGAYPAGFLRRGRALLGVGPDDPVLHVCSGRVRDYPYGGFGPNDRTLDLDPTLEPDFCQDAREAYPLCPVLKQYIDGSPQPWPAVLADPPYTDADADQYTPGRDFRPTANQVMANGLRVVRIGGRIGILDYIVPKPPKGVRFVACVGVWTGYNNRMRAYSVFERTE